MIRKASRFLALAVGEAGKSAAFRQSMIETLSRRSVALEVSREDLGNEVKRLKSVESALKKSQRHYAQLLAQSERFQERLRRLSRQILSAQEDERRKISRELHDVIAQTLTGINVRLATLRKEATLNAMSLGENIAQTQQLVEHSVQTVHQFARELRPAVLDDLGLIPALRSFMKAFAARTGIRTRLTFSADIEPPNATWRTAFFRVAQEALTNVARHAHATSVALSIRRNAAGITMRIKDNGKSFDVARIMAARGGKRLGLLGMSERIEMAGGQFVIASSPGNGTTLTAHMPFRNEKRLEKA